MKSLILAIVLIIVFYMVVPKDISNTILQLLGAFYMGELLFKLTHKLTGEKL